MQCPVAENGGLDAEISIERLATPQQPDHGESRERPAKVRGVSDVSEPSGEQQQQRHPRHDDS